MARPIRSIEIYLPLEYNDGRSIPDSKYISLQQQLLDRFGGVTSILRQFPLHGVWTPGWRFITIESSCLASWTFERGAS